MKNYYLLLILFAFSSCIKEDAALKVKACFDYSTHSILGIEDTVMFSNCSNNATDYLWDFGDSTTSTDFTPYHLYKKRGNYRVKLTAINNSEKDTLSKFIHITDQYYTNLHDTLIRPQSTSWGTNVKKYDLDIDKDNKTDITITSESYYYHFSGGQEIKIVCHNSYELAFSTYIDPTKTWTNVLPGTLNHKDTLIILPKEFNVGDIIQSEGDYKDSLMIRYLESSGSPKDQVYVNFGVSLNKDLYFAFRNEDSKILAWLKLNVKNNVTIVLNSCRYSNHGNILRIE